MECLGWFVSRIAMYLFLMERNRAIVLDTMFTLKDWMAYFVQGFIALIGLLIVMTSIVHRVGAPHSLNPGYCINVAPIGLVVYHIPVYVRTSVLFCHVLFL